MPKKKERRKERWEAATTSRNAPKYWLVKWDTEIVWKQKVGLNAFVEILIETPANYILKIIDREWGWWNDGSRVFERNEDEVVKNNVGSRESRKDLIFPESSRRSSHAWLLMFRWGTIKFLIPSGRIISSSLSSDQFFRFRFRCETIFRTKGKIFVFAPRLFSWIVFFH